MSRDSVPAEDYDSFVADSDRFFDENFDHETDDTHSAEDIVKILQSMDVASDDERDQIKANLMNSLPGGATTESLGESDYEFYGYLLLNAIVFSLFVFFGYKLYKSLTERQRKREEKLKAKQLKSKKK